MEHRDVRIAIIGGTGIADPRLFRTVEEISADTPYGRPSDKIRIAEFEGVQLAFLPRHGSGHTIPPHKVNSRANLRALKDLGVERVIGLAAVGSLRHELKPGDIVIPDQFIDMTKQRPLTFYDGPKVVHVSMADPFCPQLRSLACDEAKALGIRVHGKGTYVCVEGPRFSTRAESNLWRVMHADIVGMTLVPEAQLARELELCYLSISSVTDYDVWAEKPVSAKDVLETMKRNTVTVQNMLKKIIPAIKAERDCRCGEALKDAGL
ncbi:MAG: S-methyl-5'-thioadenosine phosphorylase [Candidatus Aenigmarchaeota archaeon]|nr:S-methyl-5'-thioadenosine phosphorylase [Candidatus Aenigmarchaeota archaeon]